MANDRCHGQSFTEFYGCSEEIEAKEQKYPDYCRTLTIKGKKSDSSRHFWVCHIIMQQALFEPQHEISNNVACATSKGSDLDCSI